ncbi:hypothetical protein CUT44_11655 [Streptomyces carminius]|uniref:Uncharacterized protein n=1 Tax=Streptomyces carminius TaxID=2665496 RepID=A0A2M8M0Q1_9ACTN|nr:hypothetical protein [Streptomyces carminius]PJE97060.1 hypothetical protein CUT44_14910 [Streptomyces carminius]PJE97769.1 hypothetical protein CUT44_11655 [Streptomyces carminius]
MVALLLAVGAGAWFLGGDDGGTAAGADGRNAANAANPENPENPEKEHDGRFETLWKKAAPDTSDLADQGGYAYGTWFADGRLVRALFDSVVAYDLATGRTKWLSEPTRTGQTTPLALWDGRLLGYELPTPDEAGRLTSIDPGTGRATRYAELPDGDWKAEFAMQSSQSRPYWHDGRLFLVAGDFFTGEHPGRGGLLAYG